MISRPSETREQSMNWSEWNRETRTDDTNGGFRVLEPMAGKAAAFRRDDRE
jgi:hypothetical protein